MPEPNGGFVGGVHDDYIIIAGGSNWKDGKKLWLKTFYHFYPKEMRWAKVSDLDTPIAYGISWQKQIDGHNRTGFAGGFNGTQAAKVHAILNGDKTTIVQHTSLPDSSTLSAGGGIDDDIIIAGGTHDPADIKGLKKSAYKFNVQTGSVTQLPDYPGPNFGTSAYSIAGKELFIFGGVTWLKDQQKIANLSEAYAYSVTTNTWRKLRPLSVATRGITAVTLSDNFIYLAGGFTENPDKFTAQAYLYDIAKDEYLPTRPLPHASMVGLIVCGDYLYCLGGEDKQRSRTAACFRIPIASLLK